MATRLAMARMLSAPEEWNRRRLQVVLGVVAVLVSAVAGGIVWSVIELLGVGGGGTTSDGTSAADEPTLSVATVPVEAAQPGPLSKAEVGSIAVPQPTSLGEAQVGTGFPGTPEGALGQLVAIDQRALESSSVVVAQDVIAAWAAPGGPTATTWSGVAAVQALLESAGLPANGWSELRIQLDPAMGLIQSPGASTTTTCVDFIVIVAVGNRQPNRIAVADCQHMTWHDERWMIAPGDEAPPMPSLWPGTQASYDVGYEWLEIQP